MKKVGMIISIRGKINFKTGILLGRKRNVSY